MYVIFTNTDIGTWAFWLVYVCVCDVWRWCVLSSRFYVKLTSYVNEDGNGILTVQS